MDEFDEDLLANVDQGIIKYTALAKKLNAPLSTVHFRIKRLEREKLIKYYKGDIDWKKAGFSIMAFVLVSVDVSLLKSIKKKQDALVKEIQSIPYVRECYVTTSEADLIVKIIAKDPGHLKEIVLDNIQSKEGIINTRTMIVLD